MLRLDHESGDGTSGRIVDALPATNLEPGQIVSHNLPVDALQLSKDRFCLSIQAIASNSGNGVSLRSPWSKQRCYTRLAGGEEDLPVYLPWPDIDGPSQGDTLLGGLVTNFRKVPDFLAMRLAREPGLLEGCERLLPGQIPGQQPDPFQPEEEANRFDDLECTDAGMAAVKAALKPVMNFILYRQTRVMGGEAGDWIQVTPLIDYVHFDDIPPRQPSEKDASLIEWRLNDPYVKFIYNGTGIANDTLSFILLDRYPFSSYADILFSQPYEYRYQAVYFDDRHRPVRWQQTNWFREDE